MKDTVYLVCTADGVKKLRRTHPPKLKQGQVVIKVLVAMDNRVFMPVRTAEAKLEVDLPIPTLERRDIILTQIKEDEQ